MPFLSPEDFDVFTIPDFAGRMQAIRERLKSRLVALGESLRAPLEKCAGAAIYPQVAQHMRRRTNPPISTWVAFSPVARGYKPYAHLRVALHEGGVRAMVVAEAEAREHANVAYALECEESARRLARELAALPGASLLSVPPGGAIPAGPMPSVENLRAMGTLMLDRALDFAAGVEFSRDDPAWQTPESAVEQLVPVLRGLVPIYLAGRLPAA